MTKMAQISVWADNWNHWIQEDWKADKKSSNLISAHKTLDVDSSLHNPNSVSTLSFQNVATRLRARSGLHQAVYPWAGGRHSQWHRRESGRDTSEHCGRGGAESQGLRDKRQSVDRVFQRGFPVHEWTSGHPKRTGRGLARVHQWSRRFHEGCHRVLQRRFRGPRIRYNDKDQDKLFQDPKTNKSSQLSEDMKTI